MNWKIIRPKGNIVELFIDKVVLAIVAIAVLVILFLFVIGSPNAVEYAGQKLSPAKIDKFINDSAAKLQEKLEEEPIDSNSYEPQLPLYTSFIESSIRNVNTNISFPLPRYSSEADYVENRVYSLPAIGQITKPLTNVVTMAAYVPIEELSDSLTYEQAETELADIDLITVESSINAKQLYEDFKTAFTGRHLPTDWRIKEYATAIFAKVELQRRTLQKDGSPGQWSEIPKIKICNLDKKLQVPSQINEYEIQIALVQFEKPENRTAILQPDVYDNAIPAKPWICPSFYNEREKRLEKERQELERQRLEAERAEKLKGRASTTRTQRTSPGESGEASSARTRRPPQRTSESTEPSLTEEEQFYAVQLTDQTDMAALEKLVFWAHDDTAKPGEKYQYRIRIGILNPIAGKNWLSQEQESLNDQVLLYSSFSEPSDIVEIPRRIHFFAINSREVEKKGHFIDKSVDVKVARYTIGNWVTKTFTIRNGDKIGTSVNIAETKLKETNIQVESIDLSTDFVMMGTRQVAQWSGSNYLRPKYFDEFLYCKTTESIQAMPIKERNWSEETKKIYKEIEQAEAAGPIFLLPRGMSKSSVQSSPQRHTTTRPTDEPQDRTRPTAGRRPASRRPTTGSSEIEE
ncbi:MAG: hypothetical protein A2173_04120 [Planctomycetes bacterium RBG_13_44_8b]|nr:MAG: hypothetical protein A2173_04120 [Planctomycetes bacterium RBG_13_44_8b]